MIFSLLHIKGYISHMLLEIYFKFFMFEKTTIIFSLPAFIIDDIISNFLFEFLSSISPTVLLWNSWNTFSTLKSDSRIDSISWVKKEEKRITF